MKYYIHSSRTVLAALIVAMTVTMGTGIPLSAHAAPEQKPDHAGKPDRIGKPDWAGKPDIAGLEQKIFNIRQAEEYRLRKAESLYSQQAQARAEQLRATAAKVAEQGGDPQPLLDAATYFDSEAE